MDLEKESEEFDSSEEDSGQSDLEVETKESPTDAVGNKKRKAESNKNHNSKKVKCEEISESARKEGKKDLYKQPSIQELISLKETENLYNSGLFRLQIEELVAAITIKEKHKRCFSKWIEDLKKLIIELPEYESIHLSSIQNTESHEKIKKKSKRKLIRNLAKYDNRIKSEQDMTLKFVRPENVNTFGLFKVNALPGPRLEANVNIEMPSACFHVKDYVNNRYFVKRYYYLAYIATALEESNLGTSLSWTYHNGLKLLPILQVTPKNSDKVTINIFATPAKDYFKPTRFLPDKNNVKQNHFSEDFPEVDEEIMKWTQTLSYNSALVHDVTLNSNNTYIEETLKEYSNVQEGLKILCVWAKQRELSLNYMSLTKDIITNIIIHLVKQKRLNKYMSSYQVIRAFWDFLIRTDIREKPITICDSVSEDTLVDFQNNYDIVILDQTGCYNVASYLTEGFYEKIRTECQLAFKLLDSGEINAFYSLFITKVPVSLQYDLIINFDGSSGFQNVYEKSKEQDRGKFLENFPGLIIKYIAQFLKRGFNKRALLIVPYLPQTKPWMIKEKDQSSLSKVMFGVNLNPEHAFDFLERGPALNDPNEKDFSEFWGPLSSDRRFRDGTACVAVYFETKTVKDKRDIVEKIVDYVVSTKMQLEYKLHFNEAEELLLNPKVTASYDFGTNEETSLKVIQSSDDLAKKLRELDMSLTITGVQGTSNVFSYTDIFPPIPTTYRCGKTLTNSKGHNILLNEEKKIGVIPKYVKPIDCVLQLERSSKWPDDLKAVQYMKIAFYLEISKLLGKKYNIISSVRREYLDVFYEGVVFRYRIFVPKEVSLLKKETSVNGVIAYKETPVSVDLEKKLDMLPKLRGALKGLQSQHPSYGPSTALIKRWLNSHLIDDYLFPEIVIDLLNASLYISESVFLQTQMPQIGFFRFLKFFAELQWDLHPVIVNFNEMLSKNSISEVESMIEKNREAYPSLYIITPYDDKTQSIFTKSAPTKEVLLRVRNLAEASLKVYESIVHEEQSIPLKSLFVPSLTGYNVIIHLKPLMNPRRFEQVQADQIEKKIILDAFKRKESTLMPVVDFNPVQNFLRELRDNFGEFAAFFHDAYGGNVIGLLWKPAALVPKDFKVSYVNGRKIVDDKLVLDIDALIEDFYILGKDVIKSIEKK